MWNAAVQSATVPAHATASIASGSSLLRFTTAGSVDDGKSTLIGRLLYDSRGLYEDQIAAVRKSGINRSSGPMDLSLFTDGLRAEREQGITIDVAYRYFSTVRRKFIIADTPGHEQYTRNMATGASTADAAVILIDASKGLLPQSRRHIYISALLGINHIIAAVNKMDLVGYSQSAYRDVSQDFQEFCLKLGVQNTYAVPVSALHGNNIVQSGSQMGWYEGPTLLQLLEELPATRSTRTGALRFPVQYVIRPHAGFRGFAGRVSSGALHKGANVVALPSGVTTSIRSIVTFDGELNYALPGSSVTVTLQDEIDLGRGDMLAAPDSRPHTSSRIQAHVIWMHPEPMRAGKKLLLKHTTRTVRATVTRIRHRIDVNTLCESEAGVLEMNDIGWVTIESTQPLHFDPYHRNRATGSFILIDPTHNGTVAAGMVIENQSAEGEIVSAQRVRLSERIRRNGHPPAAVWVVNQPDLALVLERAIFERGWNAQILSADEFEPHQLNAAAKVLQASGAITLFSLPTQIAPTLLADIQGIFGREYLFEISSTEEGSGDIVGGLLQRLDTLAGGVNENPLT
ncbi:MAG TPA: sulfate adenylyltransferase subunit CysN [Candidatus Angelobacter sp.]|nr:sulfate adenylyltransferase subunit CysN [Candidatus Angelobacter sp.]